MTAKLARVRTSPWLPTATSSYATPMYLWALVQGGMSPLEALRSGTLRGAEALGLELGFAVGKLAHLLLVNGNPLERIQ